jgi:hypothetical protein
MTLKMSILGPITASTLQKGGADMPQTNITDLTYEEIFDLMVLVACGEISPDTQEILICVSKNQVFVILRSSSEKYDVLNLGFAHAPAEEEEIFEALCQWMTYRPFRCVETSERFDDNDLRLPKSVDLALLSSAFNKAMEVYEELTLEYAAQKALECGPWHLGVAG